MKTVVILGRAIQLSELSKVQLKGITIGDSLGYRFYDGEVYGMHMLFIEPKKGVPTPRILAITSMKFSSLFQKPTVYLLASCQAYERQRLIDKNVYFLVSDKFAYLPNLMLNERVRMTKPAERLTPIAQYLLLYHLQQENIEGSSAKDLEHKIPYSYASITLGITCLEELGLATKIADGPKRKSLHFEKKGRDLWNAAQGYLINPIEEIVFCDDFKSDINYPICGINALAHYTMLNKDPEVMFMLTTKQWREIKSTELLVCPNQFDGNIKIEIWKYPPISIVGEKTEWADKLSLAISLQDDSDPRVEGEVERLINETEWKV